MATSLPRKSSGHGWHILTLMPSRDPRLAGAQSVSDDTGCGVFVGTNLRREEFNVIVEQSFFLVIADGGKGGSNRGIGPLDSGVREQDQLRA